MDYSSLSSWMAPEAAIAALMSGEMASPPAPSDASDAPKEGESSWKLWAGRRAGEKDYVFGDFSRGMFSQAKDLIRDNKHKMADVALQARESFEKSVASRAEDLLEAEGKASPSGTAAVPKESSFSEETKAERWWCLACQAAHKGHTPAREPLERPEDARGCLEVRLLSLGSSEEPLSHAGGRPAIEPVCQFALEGKTTGALRLPKAEGEEGDADEAACTNEARFYFKEVVGSDLRVHLWDRGDTRFGLGFEDQTFCGGAFVPLSTIIQMGSRSLSDQFSNESFDIKLKVKLLPLSMVRTKNKLEPCDATGAKQPSNQHGCVVLHLKLQLYGTPAKLRYAEPVLVASRTAVTGHISDVGGTLKAAAFTVTRAGRAADLAFLLVGLEKCRSDPLSLILLQLWWAWTALRAPAWAWPTMVAILLPVISWRSGGPPPSARDSLYVADEDDKGSIVERTQRAVAGAAKVQQNILQITDDLTGIVVPVEKVKFALTGEDPFTSAVFSGLVLIISVMAGISLQLLILFADWGLLRPIVWLLGGCLLMPQSCRQVLFNASLELSELQKKYAGDQLSRMASAMWLRVPDAVETSHLDLCLRYTLELVPQ